MYLDDGIVAMPDEKGAVTAMQWLGAGHSG